MQNQQDNTREVGFKFVRGLIGERISFQNEAFFECSVDINH